MYPDLSYLFHDLFNTPYDNWTSVFKTFGLLLAIAFVVAAYVVYIELKRKEKEGIIKPITKLKKGQKNISYSSLLINSLIGFILGYKLIYIFLNFEVFQQDGAGMVFSSLGNWPGGIVFGLLYGGYYYWNWYRKKEELAKDTTVTIHPYEKTGDIIVIAAVSGIVGARLFSILENLDSFFQDPIGQLFSGSGLTIYGGLIVAFIVVYYFVKKWGIPPIHMMDIAALAIILGYGIGRLGCHFSGDGDWGIVNEAAKPAWFILPDWMWAYDYPNNVADAGVLMEGCEAKYCRRLVPPVYPTPVWETILSLLIFAFLWIMRKRIKIAGILFFMYMVLNGIERFFIETIRVNPRYDFMGLNWSQAQYISIGMILGGIIGIVYLYRRSKAKA
jgi:phosphatidylglycerol:prolipoprotein diacylglycerol transferase